MPLLLNSAAVPRPNPAGNGPIDEPALRRERIVSAVLQLAAEGGYDAVQLREVSALSGVALRTIYKYYGSREAMISIAMKQWQKKLVREAIAAAKGVGFVQRTTASYQFMFDAFRAQPKYFDTLVGLQRAIGAAVQWAVDEDDKNTDLEGLDEEFAADFVMIVGSTVYSALHFCVYGQHSFDEGWTQIERTIRRLGQTPTPSKRVRSKRS